MDDNGKNEERKRNYFDDDPKLTIDGTEYKRPNYLTRSYVLGPIILMSILLGGSIFLINSMG